ncbi:MULTISPECIES: RluA family pseudouridine synthase [Bacteroidota]|jgi:23S rRNA pseudouridine1911/1915/1917 synthase|uniref:RluA family pseudouridine synthase n=2 Tax=Flectobacillus TaxID=101 RepID=A0ABT6Z8V3_9BACT|nr:MULTISPECIES: RluA family pseudouridine synthase [Bacteroidota]MDI9860535.1 RluA family pseudouridine synthase [Flectobacillus roseus]MDI9869880.1 RluA family pseudouridine synthase [Flectobacillus roseus]MDI9877558.1 RluA family pseudouridine synthase [Flectobacillus rivi]
MKDFHVVYEDNHIIIVSKRAGILVQGDSTGDRTLTDAVKEYIKKKYDKPGDVFLHPVHRLDRPVSGLVIFARTSKGLERMMEVFRKREIQKTYWAVVRKKPANEKGKLTHWLVKDEKRNVVTAHDTEVNGSQKAELYYKVLGTINKHYLLEVEPISGRPHQIRVQLASMGCPIRGDLKYGYDRPNADGSINLHARRLYFTHPIKKEPIICKAAVPPIPFWEEFLELDPEDIKQKNLGFLHE